MPQGDVKEATTVGYAANSLDRENDSSAAHSQSASMENHVEGTGQTFETWIKAQQDRTFASVDVRMYFVSGEAPEPDSENNKSAPAGNSV